MIDPGERKTIDLRREAGGDLVTGKKSLETGEF